ncbi:hypothetical protein SAMN02745248_02402 [Hathewaya proteolytica DSM 3090]|uniref:Phage XkdN-like tail assembly chaperone protein, TAC n=1 Tax=Hathewaya proteolytica DSM 3090 TaxID=1121331 RepID=A0A1M6RZW2_9CLOT|nr:hypothetical protein [Hathewaya proteolytica]SHK37859.1 hypothetical protein SAMN02745248_02402 [Hathewaya proteolytica DSM 3090]
MIDITSKLTDTKPIIKIAEGKEYEIDNSKNTMLKVNQLFHGNVNDIEMMDNAIRMILGEKAFKEIEGMNLSLSDYKVIFTGMMAGVSDITYEEAERRFQNATK